MPTTHAFRSTGAAYNACQTDDSIKPGDILIIANEGVIGIADTWPVAITKACGELHTIRAEVTDAAFAVSADIDPACIAEARRLAAAVEAAGSLHGNFVVSIGSAERTVYAGAAINALETVIQHRPTAEALNVRRQTPEDAKAYSSNQPAHWTTWRND